MYEHGSEPDPRFSLANERTALAWVRTGLALVAGGVALTSFALIADLAVIIDLIAVVTCLAGGALAVNALVSWRRTERALRRREPLPSPRALPVLVVGVATVALVLSAFAAGQALG